MKPALIIPVFNRPQYVAQCFDSLQRANIPKDTLVLLINDASTDRETNRLFDAFTLPNATITKVVNKVNKGIKSNLLYGYEYTFENGCDVVINLDSDAIVKPDFIQSLLKLHKQFPDKIVSGFNSLNKDGSKLRNPIISEHKGYSVKMYANGINMCIGRSVYDKYIKPALQTGGNWDFEATKETGGCIVHVPSLVQHIGLQSSMGHSNNPDVAADFKILSLPDVTLFGIDAHDPKGIERAANICTQMVEFGDVKIITERLFFGREGYSKFCIKDMAQYISTSHVLIIHPDGYIQNPLAWDNEWLKYDYIGALWGFYDNMCNGNGGFSLRSKKLLDIISKLDLNVYHPEDEIICRELRPMLEKKGIRFAPAEVCNLFSIEAYGGGLWKDRKGVTGNAYKGSFGFHGYNVTGLPVPTNKVGMPTGEKPTFRTGKKKPIKKYR